MQVEKKRKTVGLPFTTISLNKNYAGRMHRDAGNIGPSIGLAIGTFTGGKLRYWAGDSQKGARSAEPAHPPTEKLLNLGGYFVRAFDFWAVSRDGFGRWCRVMRLGDVGALVSRPVGRDPPRKTAKPPLALRRIWRNLPRSVIKNTSAEVKRKMVSMGADWPTSVSWQQLREHVPTPDCKKKGL